MGSSSSSLYSYSYSSSTTTTLSTLATAMRTSYLVFSTAGKLVFCSPASAEQQAATHVGVLQTLIAIYADDASDKLRHIRSAASTLVFLLRPPLYLVAIATATPARSACPQPPPALLRIHLDALHLQLTSIVPAPKLARLFTQRPGYDLRASMLTGTEPFLHRLIASLDLGRPPAAPTAAGGTGTEGGWPWLLGALQPIKMEPSLRAQLGQVLQPPPRETANSSSTPAPEASSATPSIIASVGNATASTLSLLNPIAYLNPSQTAAAAGTTASSTPARPKDLLYVLVLFRSQLITLLRPRKHSVHAADMHLLINAARASISSRSKEVAQDGADDDLESWVPVCLPRFAPAGFVWAHISLLPQQPVSTEHKQSKIHADQAGAAVPSSGPTSRRPGLPTQHVSTATAASVSSASSTQEVGTRAHVDGLPSTTLSTSTSLAVASAMRSSLRSSSSLSIPRSASPVPPALSSASSASGPRGEEAAVPSTSQSSPTDSPTPAQAEERAFLSSSRRKNTALEEGDDCDPHVASSETSSVAETETDADRTITSAMGTDNVMSEQQEAELMASISALRASDRRTPSYQSAKGKERERDESAAETTAAAAAASRGEDYDDLTLVLVSGDPDAFASLSLWRRHIIALLSKRTSSTSLSLLERLRTATSGASTSSSTADSKATDAREKGKSGYSADELKIPGLRHFIYKSRTATQLTAPRFEAPYVWQAEEEGGGSSQRIGGEHAEEGGGDAWRRLTGLYGLAWDGLHAPRSPDAKLFGLDLGKEGHKEARRHGLSAKEEETSKDKSSTEVEEATPTKEKATWPAKASESDSRPSTREGPDRAQDDTMSVTESMSITSPTNGPTAAAPALLQTQLSWTTTSPSASYAFLRTPHEAVLGWLTSGFEVYLCVSPWMRRRAVVALAGKVAKWVKEREEELFLLAPPVF